MALPLASPAAGAPAKLAGSTPVANATVWTLLSVTLRRTAAKPPRGGICDKTDCGIRHYLKTPRLRGLLGVKLAAAAASAMAIVNTPVLGRGAFGLGQGEVAITLAAKGARHHRASS